MSVFFSFIFLTLQLVTIIIIRKYQIKITRLEASIAMSIQAIRRLEVELDLNEIQAKDLKDFNFYNI